MPLAASCDRGRQYPFVVSVSASMANVTAPPFDPPRRADAPAGAVTAAIVDAVRTKAPNSAPHDARRARPRDPVIGFPPRLRTATGYVRRNPATGITPANSAKGLPPPSG